MLQKNHWRAFLILAATLAIGAFVAGISSPDVRAEVAKSTSRQPTPFTELYFTNARYLPRDLRSGGPFTFQFTIANHEGKAVEYSYLVTAEDPGGTRSSITQRSIVVDSGISIPLSASFSPARTNTTYLVTVQLVGRPETIHFRGTS